MSIDHRVNPDRRGNMKDALSQAPGMLAQVHAIVNVVRSYHESWGDWPTALQVAEQLGIVEKQGG